MSIKLKILFSNVSDALNGAFQPEKSDDYKRIWHEVMEGPHSEKENLKNDFNNILKDTNRSKRKLEQEFQNG